MSPRLRRDLLAGTLAATVSLAGFTAYWMTHGAGPHWQDSGLFIAALKAGGGLLPPGYPVYLLLGRPFVMCFEMLLPGRPFAEAANVFSALWASLAAGLTCLSVLTLRQPGYRFLTLGPPSAAGPQTWSGGLLGGLLAAFSYSLWYQALTAEAYAMNAFFTAATLFLALRLGGEGPLGPILSATQKRWILLLLVVHGLSFGNHPVTMALVPALGWLAWNGRAARKERRFLLLALSVYAASATLPYLYLPWATWAYPAAPYGSSDHLAGLLAQATGTQWSGDASNYGFSLDRFLELPVQVWREMFGPGLFALVFGARLLIREHPRLARFFLATLLPCLLLPLLYRRGGEYDFWLLSAYMVLFVVAGAGLDGLIHASTVLSRRFPIRVATAALLAFAVLAPSLWINPPLVDRRADFVPEDFGRNLYRPLETGAVFVAISDQENALTYYLDVVARERLDVIRIDGGVMSAAWFPSQLRARYPEFAFEDISRGRSTSPAREEWLAELMRAAARGSRPFYMTTPPALPPPPDRAWVPAGGLWKLAAQGSTIDRGDWEYTYRTPVPFNRPARDHAPERAQDGTIRREPYVAQIQRFHVQAWKNLGDWSLDHDDYAQAAAAYAQALSLDPGLENPGIFFGLGKSLFVLDRPLEARPYLERVGGRVDSRIVAEASLYLGQIHEGLGDLRAAREYFDTVRRLAPDIGARLPPSPVDPNRR